VWQGSGFCSGWYDAFEAYAAKADITDAKIPRGNIHHLDIEAGYGYLVATVTFTLLGDCIGHDTANRQIVAVDQLQSAVHSDTHNLRFTMIGGSIGAWSK
jgi:hypothetical protein